MVPIFWGSRAVIANIFYCMRNCVRQQPKLNVLFKVCWPPGKKPHYSWWPGQKRTLGKKKKESHDLARFKMIYEQRMQKRDDIDNELVNQSIEKKPSIIPWMRDESLKKRWKRVRMKRRKLGLRNEEIFLNRASRGKRERRKRREKGNKPVRAIRCVPPWQNMQPQWFSKLNLSHKFSFSTAFP